MPATAVLKEEHGGIEVMLGILEKVCDLLQAGGYPESEHIDGILEFLQVFVDTCHHGKEEEILFPALEKAATSEEMESVRNLLADHVAGRERIRKMVSALPAVRKGDGPAVNRFVKNAREYVALLRGHIEREDKKVFPLADDRLSQGHQQVLFEEFERIEEDRVGHGKHDEFHRLLDRLRISYGV
jgi:hemerythrin-like domain-containing protein